jgi:hypothetical protein
MKKLALLAATAGLLVLLAPTSAFAQKALGPKGRLFAKYDTNKNGVIDGDEIIAMQKDFAADPNGELKRYDTNNDGKLSAEEIAAIKPPGSGNKKSGDKKAKTATADATAPADATPATDKPAADKAAADKPADPKPADAPKDPTKQ